MILRHLQYGTTSCFVTFSFPLISNGIYSVFIIAKVVRLLDAQIQFSLFFLWHA